MDPLLRSLKEEKCKICEGMGMRVVEDEQGRRYAEPCVCRSYLRGLRAMEKANIPIRHESSTFETFTSYPGRSPSIGMAPMLLRRFVDGWSTDHDGTGLLITGGIGTGKTHLAVATLRALITEHNAVGLFYDHRSLLKAIQNSYNERSSESEYEVLAPVFQADVLVLDELGREKRSDWTGEMVEHILNTRYNDRRTTIITTNYPNEHSAMVRGDSKSGETLGDRVGERIFSRIQEMCLTVEMNGLDFRKTIKRAQLS
ncbi:ATP-binding protein [Terriglobus aquaticus]|nr:ATP-binding protein [Terriglobus aquaticus]